MAVKLFHPESEQKVEEAGQFKAAQV